MDREPTHKPTKADLVFTLLAKAAADGARCPTNREIAEALESKFPRLSPGSIPEVTTKLAHEGRIVIRIYGHNWREVVICDGLHSGKATQAPPGGARPWKVIGGVDRVDQGDKQ